MASYFAPRATPCASIGTTRRATNLRGHAAPTKWPRTCADASTRRDKLGSLLTIQGSVLDGLDREASRSQIIPPG